MARQKICGATGASGSGVGDRDARVVGHLDDGDDQSALDHRREQYALGPESPANKLAEGERGRLDGVYSRL
jgi:hypothetical protein